MKHLTVDVYRSNAIGDCTANGVTSRHDTMTLFWDCEKKDALNYCAEKGINVDAALWLNPRILWNEYHPFAEPLIKPVGLIGPMSGGNFVFTSDSRFPSLYGKMNCAHFPIPVHDRFETPEYYNSMD
jgi:hypothetical protein